MSLVITRRFNKFTGQIDFFSEGQSDIPEVNEARVNLSRGGFRPYRLDNLQAHNGSGANWTDGASYHTPADRAAYEARTAADIKAAIEEAVKKSQQGETLAVVNGAPTGGVLFGDAPQSNVEDDIFDEDEDEDDVCETCGRAA